MSAPMYVAQNVKHWRKLRRKENSTTMSDTKLETPKEHTDQETRKRFAHEQYDEPAKKRPRKRGLVKVIDVPHMLAQWVHEKNAKNDLDPKEVSAQSARKAWFRCDQNHERFLRIYCLYKPKGCLLCVLAKKRWTLEKLKQMSTINEDTGCQIWEGPRLIKSKNRNWSPHGLALYLTTGKHVNQEMPHVRHLCGNATCVNPEHLQLGTAMENAMDKDVTKTQLNGEKNPKSKLSDEERKSIYASKETNSILAETYGVSVSTISKIKTGTTGSAVTQSHDQQLKVREHERKRLKAAKPLTKEDYLRTMERCFKKCKLVTAEPNDASIVLQKPCKVFQGYLMDGYALLEIDFFNTSAVSETNLLAGTPSCATRNHSLAGLSGRPFRGFVSSSCVQQSSPPRIAIESTPFCGAWLSPQSAIVMRSGCHEVLET